MTHMKTTLELDDELLAEAKVVAARRRTTLRAMVEHALRRELAPAGAALSKSSPSAALGIPSLPKKGATNPNAELHRRLSSGDVEEAIAWLDRAKPRAKRQRR